MDESERLEQDFFARPTLEVARDLLGRRLVRLMPGPGSWLRRLAGYITEVEAYCGESDLGCHAKAGRTPRTRVMYGPPGRAYVYFTYGMHWMFNVVTEAEGSPAAALVRAIFPSQGIDCIALRRPPPRWHWADGPAKLCQALAIDRAFNAADLTDPQAQLFIETGYLFPDSCVTIGPRVGLYTVPEPWKSKPWRFLVKDARRALQEVYQTI